jgi:hypothetical protein
MSLTSERRERRDFFLPACGKALDLDRLFYDLVSDR